LDPPAPSHRHAPGPRYGGTPEEATTGGLSITRDATVVAEVSSTSPDPNLSNNSDRVTIRLQ
jgi:hypothetical protein